MTKLKWYVKFFICASEVDSFSIVIELKNDCCGKIDVNFDIEIIIVMYFLSAFVVALIIVSI